MDFKVTGTRDGVTALQMDIKVQGISEAIIRDGLKQALAARLTILDKMAEVLPEARAEMSDFAPRIITIKINPEKIREIIGKGGSMIRKIQEETQTEINVEDDGTVEIAAVSGENSRKAIQWIESLTREVEVGALYLGKVTRIMGFGAFVEILPGQGRPRPHRRARRLPRADRRGRRVRRRRGHGRRHRDRPPGPRQPLAQGRDAAPPGQGPRLGRPARRRGPRPGIRHARIPPPVGVAVARGALSTRSGRHRGLRSRPGTIRERGRARLPWGLGSAVPKPGPRRSERRARCQNPVHAEPCPPRPPHRRRRRRHRRRRSDDDPVLQERARFPVGELRLLASGRSAGRTVSDRRRTSSRSRRRRRRPSRASTSPCSAPAATSRRSSRPRPRSAARRSSTTRPRGAWTRPSRSSSARSTPTTSRARGHHRQPELLDDAARAVLMALRDSRRARAGRRRHLPVRHGTGADAIAELEARSGPTSPASRRGRERLPAPDRLQRPARDRRLPRQRLHEGGVEGRHREPQDPAPAGPADLVHGRPRPGLRQPLGGRPRRDARPDHAGAGARRCSPRCPGVVVEDDPAEHATRWRPRPPAATRSSSGGSARTRRSPTAAGLAFWVVCDNLRKGAATNAVELAEVLVERGWVRRRRRAARRRDRGPGAPRATADAERRAALEAIAAEVRVCTAAASTRRGPGRPRRGRPGHRGRVRGRGPGLQRGPQGRPFVGRAGDLLVKLLGLDRLAARRRVHHQRRQVPAARTTATPSPTRSRPARRTCAASSRSSTRRWS